MYMHIQTHAHTYVWIYMQIHIYIDIYVYIHTHINTCIYGYKQINTPYNGSNIFIEIVIPIIFYCFIFTYRVKR